MDRIEENVSRLKNARDYYDTEIGHYSVVGWNSGGREIDRITAFTCDDIEETLDKIGIYSFFVDHTGKMIQKAIEEGERPAFNYRDPVYGRIGFCDETGSVKEIYETEGLPKQLFG